MCAVKLRCGQQMRAGRNSTKFKSASGAVHSCRGAIDKRCSVAFSVGEHHLHLTAGKVLYRAEKSSAHRNRWNSLQMEVGIAEFAAFRQGNFRSRREI